MKESQNCSQDYDEIKKLMNVNEAGSHLTGVMEILSQAEQKLLCSRIWMADPKFEILKRLYWKNVQNSLSHWNQNQKKNLMMLKKNIQNTAKFKQ
ncbi:uncharacterized protein LOC143256846 isoform X2 [Tachypleus tridentatus]|uniref:uncharacterized protein LOC143256846 isoform X2 n=1 Tax=Tachypleus tridentatus TaxID=6853 RepID=UPI003FD4C109